MGILLEEGGDSPNLNKFDYDEIYAKLVWCRDNIMDRYKLLRCIVVGV
jgi:hypothetical protein